MDKTEAKLEFLTRVAEEFYGTLNAASAIERMEILLDDVERAAEAFRTTPPRDVYRGWRIFPLDIVSYYSVAYATCLEWHARSRLTDLFTYAPGSITDKDLEKGTGNKVLAKLVSVNASIPQFLAATRNYSNADEYLDTFSRIFKFLNIKPDPREIVHSITSPAPLDSVPGGERLVALYECRNRLVHEINRSNIGHPVGHNPWSCEIAVAYGRFALTVIGEIEAVITDKAATDFPNKLLPDGHPVDLDALLDKEIAELETELTQHIAGFGPALEASRTAIAAELEMLQHAGELHLRWLDLKAPARRALRRGRLQYLKASGPHSTKSIVRIWGAPIELSLVHSGAPFHQMSAGPPESRIDGGRMRMTLRPLSNGVL